MFSSLTHLPTDIYYVNSFCRRLAFKGGGSVFVDLLFNFTSHSLQWLSVCLFWYALLYVNNSSFAIILTRKRELVALHDLSS